MALVLRRGERFLLVRKPRKHNVWQCPQGGIESGETPVVALRREMTEETGAALRYTLYGAQPVAEYSYPFPLDFPHYAKPYIGAQVQFFIADWDAGTVVVDGQEIVDYKWVLLSNLSEYLEGEYERLIRMIVTTKFPPSASVG